MKIGELLQINEPNEYYSWENNRSEIYHNYFEFFTYPFIVAFGSRNYENFEVCLRFLWFRAFYNNKGQNPQALFTTFAKYKVIGKWMLQWRKWY